MSVLHLYERAGAVARRTVTTSRREALRGGCGPETLIFRRVRGDGGNACGDTRLKSPHFAPKHQHLRFAHVRWATFIPSRIKPQFTNYPVGKTARAQVHPWIRSAHDQIQ